MYSKTRNTLTALIAASLFVASGWLFGHPVSAPTLSQPIDLHVSIADSGVQGAQAFTVLHLRHANRMNLAMPYFSFSLQMPQRRTD